VPPTSDGASPPSEKSVAFGRANYSYLMDASRGDATTQKEPNMSNTSAVLRRLLAASALVSGLAIGLSANAGAQADNEEDFLQCAVDHPDTDGLGVCCVFYGGDFDERTGQCWIDFEAETATRSPDAGPTKPLKPLPTKVSRLLVTSIG
jgi:hypothetical protein